MQRIRRLTAVLAVTGVTLALSAWFTNSLPGQIIRPIKPGPQPTPTGSASNFSSIRIIENGDFRRIINVGRDCIKDKDWTQAVQALQAVLNEKKDYYVKITDT